MFQLITSKTFSCKLEKSEKIEGITAHGGLSLVRVALKKLGIISLIKKFRFKKAGYTDDICLEALILLNAKWGKSLSDWDYLKSDSGFLKMYNNMNVSVDTLERYLKRLSVEFIDRTKEEKKNEEEKKGLAGYSKPIEILHRELIKQTYEKAGRPRKLTIDIDTHLIENNKTEALYSYENFKAYQPIHAYCSELDMIVAHEFRDGNISAAEGYVRLLVRVLSSFPDGIKWAFRSDAAGFQIEFMDWMEERGITYFITAKQSERMIELLRIENTWNKYINREGITTDQEIASIPYSVSFSSQRELKQRSRVQRYIALRKLKTQATIEEGFYTHHVLVTNNRNLSDTESTHTHFKRCGSVEYANQQIKTDCGMSHLPSNDFSVNAAWYSIGIFTHNLFRYLQHFVLPREYKKLEISTLRYRLINVAAVVIYKARKTIVRFARECLVFDTLKQAHIQLLTGMT